MAKLTLTDVTAGYASVSKLNANNSATEAAVENTLSRDGTGPNAMEAVLDMNQYRIYNLPNAISNSEPVTLGQANVLAGVTNPLTQESVGAVLYPRTAAEIAAAVTPVDYSLPPGNVLRYGTNTAPGTTDMTAAFTAAFSQCAQGGADVLIPPATYLCASNLTLISNTRIRAHGATINFSSGAGQAMLGVSGITNLDWEGGTMVSTVPATLQSCVVLQLGAHHNRVILDKIQDFRNKGISIGTASHHNTVQCFDIVGCTGLNVGVGISIFGAAPNQCKYNTILPSYIHDCRVGITMNGGDYNRIIRPVIIDCELMGLTLDGVVGDGSSGDKDGPKYCYVEHPVCIRTPAVGGNTQFGGIYLGNGADWNEINGGYLADCAGAGIRSSGGVGWECENNTIIGAVCEGNGNGGFTLSSAPGTQLVGVTAKNNTGQGIQLFVSNNSQIIGGRADGNTENGLIVQSAKCGVFGFHADNNTTYGIRTNSGGSGASNNKFFGCAANGNTIANYLLETGGKFRDCEGLVTENSGLAVLLSGDTQIIVTHGLGYTPAITDIQVTPTTNPTTLNGFWFGTVTATTFTIASNTAAGTNVTFAWQARRHA